MLTLLTNADLKVLHITILFVAQANISSQFFHSECFEPAVAPRTIAQVLQVRSLLHLFCYSPSFSISFSFIVIKCDKQVATETKAAGLTAPACALLKYYKEKKVVKFFIVVTDEIENEKYQGQYFPSLFLKYHQVF